MREREREEERGVGEEKRSEEERRATIWKPRIQTREHHVGGAGGSGCMRLSGREQLSEEQVSSTITQVRGTCTRKKPKGRKASWDPEAALDDIASGLRYRGCKEFLFPNERLLAQSQVNLSCQNLIEVKNECSVLSLVPQRVV